MTYQTTTGHTFIIRTIHYPGTGFAAIANADGHDVKMRIHRVWANERLALAAMVRKIERVLGE